MKTLNAVLLVVALSGSGLRAQDSTAALDWTLIYPRPATGKYEDISFPDPTHGWVVTARGDNREGKVQPKFFKGEKLDRVDPPFNPPSDDPSFAAGVP